MHPLDSDSDSICCSNNILSRYNLRKICNNKSIQYPSKFALWLKCTYEIQNYVPKI